jgi:hypothetical protein
MSQIIFAQRPSSNRGNDLILLQHEGDVKGLLRRVLRPLLRQAVEAASAAGALSGASNLFISCHFIELLPQIAGGFKVIGLPILSFVATTDDDAFECGDASYS